MAVKKASPYKGALVYIRKTWGDQRGQIDEDTLYKVRSCGPKMAILDRVNKETLQVENSWRRGSSFYLTTKEEAERYMRDYRSLHFWDWSQLFVPVGEAGWDPESNF